MAIKTGLWNEGEGTENGLWISPLRNHLFGVCGSKKSGEVSSSYKPRDTETAKIIALPKSGKQSCNWKREMEVGIPTPSANRTQVR